MLLLLLSIMLGPGSGIHSLKFGALSLGLMMPLEQLRQARLDVAEHLPELAQGGVFVLLLHALRLLFEKTSMVTR